MSLIKTDTGSTTPPIRAHDKVVGNEDWNGSYSPMFTYCNANIYQHNYYGEFELQLQIGSFFAQNNFIKQINRKRITKPKHV